MSEHSYFRRSRPGETLLRRGQSPLLDTLDIELTERCNNNCLHCNINLPAKQQKARDRELSADEVKNIVSQAASLGCFTVRFTGGEPLLRSDFEELYFFTRRLGLKVLLFTNATLITPPLADLFSRIPPLERIEVSLYGMKKDSYEGVTRTPGSFEAAWRGIGFLIEKKVPFVVKSALLPSNKGEMEEIISWAKTIPWMKKAPPFAMFFLFRCRRDSEGKNRMINDLRLSVDEGMKVLTMERKEYLRNMREFCSRFLSPPGEKIFTCGAGVGSGCVDPYGFFSPCLMLKDPNTAYDLKKGSLKEALKDFSPKIRERKANNRDYLARCTRCFLMGLCEQCPGRSWAEHGTLDTPVEYFCEMAHAQAKYLGLIRESEKAWEVEDWEKRLKEFSVKDTFLYQIQNTNNVTDVKT
jgi:radical SAM protein with 4Fe4S-binding SPASM domain